VAKQQVPFTSRLIIMRKFAIASLLVAGMAFTGSLLAQDAAPQPAPAPAAPAAAAKPAAATPAPAPAASSSHKHKKNKDNNGQPKPKGSKSAKRTAKSTLPQTEASH
jgi:hypothetical protein